MVLMSGLLRSYWTSSLIYTRLATDRDIIRVDRLHMLVALLRELSLLHLNFVLPGEPLALEPVVHGLMGDKSHLFVIIIFLLTVHYAACGAFRLQLIDLHLLRFEQIGV